MSWFEGVKDFLVAMTPGEAGKNEDQVVAHDHEMGMQNLIDQQQHQLDQQRQEIVTHELDHGLAHSDPGGHPESPFGGGY